MGKYLKISIVMLIFFLKIGFVEAQDKLYTLEDCISYALENSTDIGRANNDVKSQMSDLEQKKAALLPNLIVSGSENWSSKNSYSSTTSGGVWSRENASNLSFSLSTSVTLYNGAKLKNAIKQGQTDLLAAESDIQTQTEIIGLNILSAYINVLLAEEQVNNSKTQLDVTTKQLEQATVRREAGVLSPSDYLNIKSQYASDKSALVLAQSKMKMCKVTLMQLMNMPVNDTFDIVDPNVEIFLKTDIGNNSNLVYSTALGLQPGIKTAELDLQSAEMDIKLAQADALPVLLLSSSVSSQYGSGTDYLNFGEQVSNQITPTVGLSLSVPIFQRKVVKNNITQAQITAKNYEYNLIDVQNELRKAIEQACTDAQTAASAYSSCVEQLLAQNESYKLAEEMFAQGLIDAVDYLTSKNNQTTAENELTSAKYNLVLQNKVIDYFMGNQIKL